MAPDYPPRRFSALLVLLDLARPSAREFFLMRTNNSRPGLALSRAPFGKTAARTSSFSRENVSILISGSVRDLPWGYSARSL